MLSLAPARLLSATADNVAEDLFDEVNELDEFTASIFHVDPPLLTSVSHEEIIREQSTDDHCLALQRRLDSNEDSPFQVDQHGILICVAPRDFSRQIVIPHSVRERLMHLLHHSKSGGHAGGLRMYSTLRRYEYWPSIAVDVYNFLRNCMSCARQRIRLRRHNSFLKLLPATKPGEQVAIDLLGPLPRTRAGYEYILVITDRFYKMTKVHALREISAYQVAKAICTE